MEFETKMFFRVFQNDLYYKNMFNGFHKNIFFLSFLFFNAIQTKKYFEQDLITLTIL